MATGDRQSASSARTRRPTRRVAASGLLMLATAACTPRAPPADPAHNASSASAEADDEPPAAAPVRDAAALQILLDQTVSKGSAPAYAAALAAADGVRFKAASGRRAANSPATVTADDLWHIGSCTKAMTGALYARLVDQGRARWGAKPLTLFPDLASDIHPDWRNITVEALLDHTSGAKDVGAPWLIARRADSRPLPDQRTETTRDWLRRPPGGQPGKFAYANVGYIMVGAAIERITRQPWEDALRTHLFDPLGIRSAGFGPPQGAQPQGHTGGLFGRISAHADLDNPAALAPAGTVHITLDEWAKFLAVFIDPAQDFLSADSLQRATTPSEGREYALGWAAATHERYGRVLQHSGSNTAWLAQALVLRDHNAAIMIVCNRYHGGPIRASGRIVAALADGVVG